MSWWDLGEWSGYRGNIVHQITCAFCEEKGNFEVVNHVEKKKSGSNKVLNYDTLRCGNCSNFVMAFWSEGSSGLFGYEAVPWPKKYTKAPEHWPNDIGRYWLQAKKNIADENWDAAALMARSALQLTLRKQDAKGKTLKDEIDDLSSKGLLPPIMNEWAHELRELGNESAHPFPDGNATEPQDAKEVVKFLDFLLEYLYSLPQQIGKYRLRKNKSE